jgi:catalase
MDADDTLEVNYWPNRHSAVPPARPEEGGYVDYPEKVQGIKARVLSNKFKEHFNQAQLFYNSLSKVEQTHLANALAFELDHCDDPVVYERMCERLTEVDLNLAQQVAEIVGAPIPQTAKRENHGKKAKGLSQFDFLPKEPTIATRRVAIIIADGYDPVAYNGIKAALISAKALPFTIAPRRSQIFAAGEEKGSKNAVVPNHHLEGMSSPLLFQALDCGANLSPGMRSTMFDSIFVPGGAESVETLRKSGRALHWVREAFGHLKAIGATGEGVEFVRDACHVEGMQFSRSGDVVDSYGVVTATAIKPESFKEAIKMVKGAKEFVDAYTYAISQHKNFDREMEGLSSMVAY